MGVVDDIHSSVDFILTLCYMYIRLLGSSKCDFYLRVVWCPSHEQVSATRLANVTQQSFIVFCLSDSSLNENPAWKSQALESPCVPCRLFGYEPSGLCVVSFSHDHGSVSQVLGMCCRCLYTTSPSNNSKVTDPSQWSSYSGIYSNAIQLKDSPTYFSFLSGN